MICVVSLWAISRRSAVLTWASIELNLLIILPPLVFSSGALRGPRGLKFFFLQRLGGLLFLLILSYRAQSADYFFRFITACLLLLKIGGFPFHQWFIRLGIHLKWELLVVILTIQKLIPLFFLAHIRSSYLVFIRILAWLFVRFCVLLVSKTKKLILFSSIFFLGALTLMPMLAGGEWKKLLLLYFLVFFSVGLLSGAEKEAVISRASRMTTTSVTVWVSVILAISGVPPFPGFFLKLEFLSVFWFNEEVFLFSLFLVGRAIFIYIYTTLMLFLLCKPLATNSYVSKSDGWAKVNILLGISILLLF